MHLVKILVKMHEDLSLHLHTDKCNELILALAECNARQSKFQQAFNLACNKPYHRMIECLHNDRVERTKKHHEEARKYHKENAQKMRKLEKEQARLGMDPMEQLREEVRQAEAAEKQRREQQA